MTKTLDENFIDWEANTFGFGYGTGEQYTIPALKNFFNGIGRDDPNSYDYKKLEAACGTTTAWLLINILCNHKVDMLEYGTSPRFGWLTLKGVALRAYLSIKTEAELYELCTSSTENYSVCYPDACNCGPKGYQAGVKCRNPFWGNQ